METRESYTTSPSEEYITSVVAVDEAERRLLDRIRRLTKEQCRGCLLLFEGNGFVLYRLSDGKKA